MILIRNILTRQKLFSAANYSALRTEADAFIGYTRCTFTVTTDIAPQEANELWKGHELIVCDKLGSFWEGRVEAIGASEGIYTITAIGHGPAALSNVPVFGAYLENQLDVWKQRTRQVQRVDGSVTKSPDTYVITTNTGQPLVCRTGPGLHHATNGSFPNGSRVISLSSQVVQSNGYNWVNVRNEANTLSGWAIREAMRFEAGTTTGTPATTSTSENKYNIRTDDTMLVIGVRKGAEYTFSDAAGFAYTADVDFLPTQNKDANIKWLRIAFNIVGGNSSHRFRILGVEANGGLTELYHENLTFARSGAVVERTSVVGWKEIQLEVYCLTTGKYEGEDSTHEVQITDAQLSILSQAPKVADVIRDVLRRTQGFVKLTQNSKMENIPLSTRSVYAQSPGQANTNGLKIIQDMINALRTHYGTEWRGGVWNDRRLVIHDDTAKVRWLLGFRDIGRDAVQALGRFLSLMNDVATNYTAVRAQYIDDNGKPQRTMLINTGVILPFVRILEVRSDAKNALEATLDAQGEAVRQRQQTGIAQLVITETARRRGGWAHVRRVRAGDWLELDSVLPGRKVYTEDFKRGGIINKHVYDSDKNTVTVELGQAR